ncbi:hypothetical protein ACFFYR_16165, partial [Paraburkholderia dipogonis]|uniref:hypothetical protein n=1 Tax=Paraburkholderia dipogonis TaxID=1211383 RepID=UPI0035E9E209
SLVSKISRGDLYKRQEAVGFAGVTGRRLLAARPFEAKTGKTQEQLKRAPHVELAQSPGVPTGCCAEYIRSHAVSTAVTATTHARHHRGSGDVLDPEGRHLRDRVPAALYAKPPPETHNTRPNKQPLPTATALASQHGNLSPRENREIAVRLPATVQSTRPYTGDLRDDRLGPTNEGTMPPAEICLGTRQTHHRRGGQVPLRNKGVAFALRKLAGAVSG